MNVLSQRGNPELGTGSSGVAVEPLWKAAAQHQPAARPPERTLSDCSLKLASLPPLHKINKGGIASQCSPVTTALPVGKGQSEMRRREELGLEIQVQGCLSPKKCFLTFKVSLRERTGSLAVLWLELR